MKVTITRKVEKRCPYRDEIDAGTLTIEWQTGGDVTELHALAKRIDRIEGDLTHEEWTREVRALVPDAVTVLTTWRTSAWDVTVMA